MDELILAPDAGDGLVRLNKRVQLIADLDDSRPDIPLLSRLREMNDLLTLASGRRAGTTCF